MKYYIIAGEASGDLHASNLIREIKKLDKEAVFRAWGGDKMQAEGAELVTHYRQMSFMGFIEVILNLRTILAFLNKCKADILSFRPDVIILVDYPGFNFRIAEFAFKQGIKVYYYISPQVWAWKRSRVFQVKKWITRMFVILPFEKDFYERYGVEVDFEGHPLLDAISQFKTNEPASLSLQPDERPIIALLPGSRKQEVREMLKIMLKIVPSFPDYRFVVAGTKSLPPALYNGIIGSYPVEVVFNETYALLSQAKAALVTSGTATLETALFGVPQVVCYRGSWISYQIAKLLVKVKYISLVNLIIDQELVKELIQNQLKPGNLSNELARLLHDANYINSILDGYKIISTRLGGPGASARIAKRIFELHTRQTSAQNF